MKIGELIEVLTDAAADLPDGMESRVYVHLCRGRDNFAIMTKEVTVDTAAEMGALIQGHPHRDDDCTVRRPIAMGFEDELAQVISDPDAQPEPPPPNSVLVQIGEEKAYRIPLRPNGKILAPGELEALRVGCLCDPGRNEQVRNSSAGEPGNVILVIHDDCPVHQTVALPLSP